MSRRSLRPQLNQIRGWVRQGRTDAWIAHQLEVTVQQIQAFKREQGLEPDAEENGAARRGGRSARGRRRADRRRTRSGSRAQSRRGGACRRRGRAQGRRRGGRGLRCCCRRGGRGGGEAQARRPAPRWPLPPPLGAHGPARGHVRPRRGGVRPVAGPRHPGRPDLRRALGGPPPGRDHDRGRPDRDPPRRRGRGRRRRLSAARRIAWRRSQDALQCDAVEPWQHGSVLRTPSAPDYWDVNFVRVEGERRSGTARPGGGRRHAAGGLPPPQARGRGRGDRRRRRGRSSTTAGWMADRHAMMRREGPAAAHADVEEVPLLETRARCASSGT